jgi:hypothetical protein
MKFQNSLKLSIGEKLSLVKAPARETLAPDRFDAGREIAARATLKASSDEPGR